MVLKSEEAKDSSDQLKEQLDTYDLFRLNLIINPNGYEEPGFNGRGGVGYSPVQTAKSLD